MAQLNQPVSWILGYCRQRARNSDHDRLESLITMLWNR
jgi:hypothetical protein